MPQLTRHQIGATLLGALRLAGLGIRDLFEGREEPVAWYFRCLAYDQSDLDIMESGAIETLHAPSALVELSLDELGLACLNVGIEGVVSYLAGRTDVAGEAAVLEPDAFTFDADALLGYVTLTVAPPALWLEERTSEPEANELLAGRLARMAREIGEECDTVQVHIEGQLDAAEGWSEASATVRPAGVSAHFTYEIPLAGTGEPELGRLFSDVSSTAYAALEGMRQVFREDNGAD